MPPAGEPGIAPVRDLEIDAETMRAWVQRAMDQIVEHEANLGDRPAEDLGDANAHARKLVEPLPRSPTPMEDLLDELFAEHIPRSITTGGPGHLSYIPGSGIFHAALADLVADSTNRYVGVWFSAPALTQLEANVVRWSAEIVGYPPGAGGFLTPGGSTANLYAIITARRARMPEDFLDHVVYASDQAHHSVVRSAVLAGFRGANVRSVPTDENFRMDVDALERAIEADRDAGRVPGIVVSNAGSTNTGAIDPLAAIADVAREHALWHHADGAYGAYFALTDRGRERLRGLDRADSITLDPHKSLFLPYGTGALLVRSMDELKRAHTQSAAYMPPRADEDLWDFSEMTPELSRDFRGLRVWLPLKAHGADTFRRALDEKMDLARWAYERLVALEHIEVLCEPELSTFAFRWVLPGLTKEELDERNQELVRRVVARGRVHISGTWLAVGFAPRISVLSFRTHQDRVQAAVDDIQAVSLELASEAE